MLIFAQLKRGGKGGGGGPTHVSWTLKSKNNAARWLKFRVQVSQLFSKIIIFTFIVVVITIFITPSNFKKNLLIVTVGQCTQDPHAP